MDVEMNGRIEGICRYWAFKSIKLVLVTGDSAPPLEWRGLKTNCLKERHCMQLFNLPSFELYLTFNGPCVSVQGFLQHNKNTPECGFS